jgi:hypothetical protein
VIEAALKEARAELDAIQHRESELMALIEEAETALGTRGPAPPTKERESVPYEGKPMTLYEALVRVLEENDNDSMTVHALAEAVNEQHLYTKRDGSPVEANQIHATTNNYRDLFEKDGPNIRLREEPHVFTTLPTDVALFRDDDQAFFDWLDEHPDGFFINTTRTPKPDYLVLHRPGCSHIDRNPSMHWTRDYVKVCATDRANLEEWAAESVGGEVTLCRTCFG